MKLEDQVVSLELAKKLKELGVKQDSLFYWSKINTDVETTKEYWDIGYRSKTISYNGEPSAWYAAFTVAELGEMLPEWVTIDDINVWICCSMAGEDGTYTVRYGYIDKGAFLLKASVRADTEADARANMLIYLIENKLITV